MASIGSLHLQSELIYALVNQIGGSTVAFSGAYVQVGYILTGETRPYDHKNGVLGRIVPNEPFKPMLWTWRVGSGSPLVLSRLE